MAAEGPDDGVTGVPEMSAVESQQEYYEAMGDADWELYEKKDRGRLLQKIAIALCGPPTEEGDLLEHENDRDILKLQGYDIRSEELTTKVFKKICEQEKYSHNGENILISFIRVVCVAPAKDVPFFKKEPRDYWVNLHSKKGKDVLISIFHVFSLRKCISLKPGVKSCRIFIDHDARVYKDWKSYLTENKLPKCVIVVPKNGQYKGVVQNVVSTYDDFTIPLVQLTVSPSPALGLGAKILNIADTTSTVAGIGAMVGAVGVMAAPVVIPFAAGTVIAVGAATSVYGIVRSSMHLADRGKHEQDISLKSSESRACWINILVSGAGLSFSAAGKIVAWAASSGTNIKILINAIQFLKYTTIASGLLGMVNGLGEMIHKYTKYKETPTKLELFQFSSSLLFFGIGVMSNQTAQEIVEDAQAKSINNIRDSLTSKAKRKMFDKITAETRRLKGSIQGNADVIKGLKTITNKNEFFAKLSKMNKQLNANKLRISLKSDGTTLINNTHQTTLSQLSELGKAGRDRLFATYGPAKVTTKNAPTRIYPVCATTAPVTTSVTSFLTDIRPEELLKIACFIKQLCEADVKYICELLSEISRDAHQAFLLLCVELLDSLIPREVDYLSSFLGSDWKIRVIYSVFDYLESLIDENSTDDEHAQFFCDLLKKYIVYGRIKAENIMKLKEIIMARINEERNKTPGQFTDARMYNGLYELRKKSREKYKTLQAGSIIRVGNHNVLIKGATVEKLYECLATYTQEECDLYLEYCFKIVSLLSAEEINLLNLVNLDEDIIMRITKLFMLLDLVGKLIQTIKQKGCVDKMNIHPVKKKIVHWTPVIEGLRNHEICTVCRGTRYCDYVTKT